LAVAVLEAGIVRDRNASFAVKASASQKKAELQEGTNWLTLKLNKMMLAHMAR
jgi:hypothetical protein